MPNIPLISTPQAPRGGAAMPLQSGPRVRVNAAPALQGAAELKRATGDAVRAPDSLADTSGIQSVGRGISQAGDVFAELQAEHQRNIDFEKVARAEIAMEEAGRSLSAELLETPNPGEWVARAQERAQQVVAGLDAEGVSEQAAQQIRLAAERWQMRTVTGARYDSLKVQQGRTLEALDAGITIAKQNGDVASIDRAMRAKVEMGAITPEGASVEMMGHRRQIANTRLETLLERGEIDAARTFVTETRDFGTVEKENLMAKINAREGRSQELDALSAEIATDPARALEKLNDPEQYKNLTPGDRAKMTEGAMQQDAENKHELFTQLQEIIDMGDVEITAQDIERNAKLTAYQRYELGRYLENRNNAAAMNDPLIYQEMITAIESFEPDGTGYDLANLQATMQSRFSGPYLDQLRERLDAKTGGGGSSAVPLGDVFSVLDDWAFKDQRFGAFETPVTTGDGGALVKKDPTRYVQKEVNRWFGLGTKTVIEESEESFSPVVEVDPVKRDEITKRVQSIKQQIEKAVQDGTVTSREEALELLSKLTRIPVSASAAAEALGAPAGLRLEGALPGVSSPLNGPNPLLPNIDSILDEYGN